MRLYDLRDGQFIPMVIFTVSNENWRARNNEPSCCDIIIDYKVFWLKDMIIRKL